MSGMRGSSDTTIIVGECQSGGVKEGTREVEMESYEDLDLRGEKPLKGELLRLIELDSIDS